jgi:hypothetical protein
MHIYNYIYLYITIYAYICIYIDIYNYIYVYHIEILNYFVIHFRHELNKYVSTGPLFTINENRDKNLLNVPPVLYHQKECVSILHSSYVLHVLQNFR